MLHQIGAGSLGPVFRGDDPARGVAVAIKALRVDLAPARSRQVADDLAGLAARLPVHPAIVAPVDAGLSDLAPYIVWPLVAGESLDVALREYGPAACVDALPRLTALADALDRAGAHGAWHGALHPRDIIVSADETWIVGLGLAPILERAGVRLSARRPYTAPEQLGGHASSPECDQFALAAIAHEWLFGRRVAGPADASLSVPLLPGIDRDRMTAAFATALAADPSDRFPSSTEFVRALERSVVDQHEARIESMTRAARRKARVPAPATPTLPLDAGDEVAETLEDDLPLAGAQAPVARFAALEDDEPALRLDERPERFDGLTRHADDLDPMDEGAAAPDDRDEASDSGEAADDVHRLDADGRSGVEDDDADDGDDAGDYRSRVLAMRARSAGADDEPAEDEGGTGRWQERDGRQDAAEAFTPAPAQTMFEVDADGRDGGGYGASAVIAALFVGLILGTAAGYGLAMRQGAPATASVTPSAPVAVDPGDAGADADPGSAFTEAPLPPAAARTAAPAAGESAAAAAPPAAAPASVQATPPSTPAAPAPERPGRLLVRSTPAGAEVRVNGEARGTTPLTLRDLPLGAYTVRVAREGFTPADARVTLTAARPSGALELTLDRPAAPAAVPARPAASATAAQATGSLVVDSRPAGATVRVDDREVGTTPVTLPALAPGTYRVAIAREGYQTWTTTVRVTAGERARVAASLVGGRFEE